LLDCDYINYRQVICFSVFGDFIFSLNANSSVMVGNSDVFLICVTYNGSIEVNRFDLIPY
jgi:hypothetical protein